MNTRITAKNRILSFELALAVLLGMVLVVPGPVEVAAALPSSAEGKPYDGINFNALVAQGSGFYYGTYEHATGLDNTTWGAVTSRESSATPVLWRIIGEDGDGSGNDSGNLTLWSEYVLDSKAFRSDSKWNHWNAATLRKWLHEDFPNSFTNTEWEWIAKNLLVTSGKGPYFNQTPDSPPDQSFYLPWASGDGTNDIGLGVDDRQFGLSSSNEVGYLKNGTAVVYWLRSPYSDSFIEALSVDTVGSVSLDDVLDPFGVRPAFQLNPSSIIFTSRIDNDADEAGGETQSNSYYSHIAAGGGDANFKLTIVNDGIGTLTGVPSGNPTVTLQSGEPLYINNLKPSQTGGECTVNYKIVNNSGRSIDYYGFADAEEYTNLEINGITDGEYTVYVWLQKNNEINSHEGTTPQYFTLKVDGSGSTYGIDLTPSGTHDFGTEPEGYDAAALEKTVDISVTGTGTVTDLYAHLSGTNKDSFEVSAVSSNQFTIKPISGLTADTYKATVTVAGNYAKPQTLEVEFDVTAGLTLTPSTLPNGTVGTPYNADIFTYVTGGTALYTFDLDTGSTLPDGLTLDNNTGVISGTPDTAVNSHSFDVVVTDSTTPIPQTATATYTITIVAASSTGTAPSVSTNTLSVQEGGNGTFTVYLGSGTDAATSANITSRNPAVATATPTSLTLGQSGTVTVKGEAMGSATISIGYSGGSRDNQEDEVQVTVTAAPAAQVRVGFDPQGGTPQPNPITVTVGGTYPFLPTVTREGYTFDGWYTAASGGSRVRQGDPVTIGADHTLYAQWREDGGGTDPGDSRQLTMSALRDDTAMVGRQYEKTVSITYTGGDSIRFTQSGDTLPASLSFDSGSGRISGTPQTGDEGTYRITIRAEESRAASPLSASRSFILTVTDTYTDPVLELATPGNDTVTVSEPYRKTLSVTYDGAGSLAYSATGLAPGLDINGASGEISGVPSAEGDYTVHITVTDGTLRAEGSYLLKVLGSGTSPVDPTPPPTSSSGGSTRSSGGSSGSASYTPASKTTLSANAFSWDGRTLTIDHDSITPLGLLSVQWDGAALTRGTDYGVYQGSVIIRFSEDFIAQQKEGDHTVRVEFLNHTGEATVTVGDTGLTNDEPNDDLYDNATHNPNTGGYPDGSYPGATDNPNTGGGRGIWLALLLGSLGAAALVKLRPRLGLKVK